MNLHEITRIMMDYKNTPQPIILISVSDGDTALCYLEEVLQHNND